MLSAFANSFKIPDLRNKILFTLGLVFVCRLVGNVPTPGINAAALASVVNQLAGTEGGGLFGLADLFSGGALRKCSVGALGIMPYISASIILQLLTPVIPSLERLAREGDVGRQKLTQFTRYLTLAICAVQSFSIARLILNPSAMFSVPAGVVIVGERMGPMGFQLLTILAMTTGTFVVMWLGEQITARGIGNGISLIITVNIISRLPEALVMLSMIFKKYGSASRFGFFHLVGLIVMLFVVVAATVAVTQGQRKIPIHTTKRIVGRKVYSAQNTFMPLKINYSGVMPIIFASALLMFPAMLKNIPGDFFRVVGGWFDPGSTSYLLFYGLLILFFSYFWVATQFNPIQIADDLKKHGGYVPGIRPGRPTAEFLDKTMTRLTLAGAVFLTTIAVLPMVMSSFFGIPFIVAQFFGGTSLLIIVGVMLDTMKQVESHLLMRHYDGFLKKGRLRGRR
jgi:preprotein translocase subunit SecY